MREIDEQYQDLEQQRKLISMQNDPRHEDTIRFLINPEKEIKERLMIFSGYKYDVRSGKWVDDETRDPKVNEEGLRFIKAEFNQVLNKFIPLSNLSAKQVATFIMSYSRRIRRDLISNIEKFGIKCIADLDQIKNNVVDTAYFILTQPIDDRGRKFIYSPIKQVESHNYSESNTQPKKHRLGW